MADKEQIKKLANELEQLDGWSLRTEAGRYYIANRLYQSGYRKVSGEIPVLAEDEITKVWEKALRVYPNLDAIKGIRKGAQDQVDKWLEV